MTRSIRTEIEIEAPATHVWEVLLDFESYPDWNPFLVEIRGKAVAGRSLAIKVQPTGRKPLSFRPRLLKVEPFRELRWRGRLFLPGIFDGEHSFVLEATDAHRVRFRQEETFQGLLVPLLWRSLDRDTRSGFDAMNEALRQRALALQDSEKP